MMCSTTGQLSFSKYFKFSNSFKTGERQQGTRQRTCSRDKDIIWGYVVSVGMEHSSRGTFFKIFNCSPLF